MRNIAYQSENGYTGLMYGKGSFAVINDKGEEVLHTTRRGFNSEFELRRQVDGFPEFLKMLQEVNNDS